MLEIYVVTRWCGLDRALKNHNALGPDLAGHTPVSAFKKLTFLVRLPTQVYKLLQ